MLAIAMIGVLAGGSAAAQGITVEINGTPIEFAGAPPELLNNSVMVPMRGVFERLGAVLSYDSATQTVHASSPTTNVLLALGSTTAVVNGQAEVLPQPAVVVNGTTLVPLRFVAQAFGAMVTWNRPTLTVMIQTAGAATSQLPPPPGPPSQTVTGSLTGIYTDTSPETVTLRIQGTDCAVPIGDSTVVLLQNGRNNAVESDLGHLEIGDQVQISRSTSGSALVIKQNFAEYVGELKEIVPLADGSYVFTLTDGSHVQVSSNAAVVMAGRTMALTDIHLNETVVIHTDPVTKMGYRVSVQTAQAPVPVTPVPPIAPVSIQSFATDISHPLKAGDVVHATMTGTPGATATFSIPEVVEDVPMTETSPGQYEGSFTVRETATNIVGGAVLGRLSGSPGVEAPAVQAAQRATIDTHKPTISSVTPEDGATTSGARPQIYALLGDGQGTGVDPQRIHLFLDGSDITANAVVTQSFVTYRPDSPLAPGVHNALVAVSDMVGNEARLTWSFTVQAAANVVASFGSNVNADTATVTATNPLTLTLRAQAGGKATFSIGDVVTSVPLPEVSAGVYQATFVPVPGENVDHAPVTAQFVSRDGVRVSAPLGQPVTIIAGPPVAPTIKSPLDGDSVSDTVVIAGSATPFATVDIDVSYRDRALGGIVHITGKAAQVQVRANERGHWQTQLVSLNSPSLLLSRGTVFTISATCVDATGQMSNATSIKVTHN
jgi:hypothetical protein